MNERTPIRTLEVERLLIREPNGGRIRAELAAEAAGPVTLTLLAPGGSTAARVRVDAEGEAEVVVGDPDRGNALILGQQTVDLWADGNVVASFHTAAGARSS